MDELQIVRVIRRGVFETNSSSTHSISIFRGDFIPEDFPLEAQLCAVYPGEFGWDVADYYDAATKASYALTHAANMSEPGKSERLNMLRSVLESTTGVPVEFRSINREYRLRREVKEYWGYIDHQSVGVCEEAFRSFSDLRSFIFNPKSCLHTDNDNH